MDPLSSRISTTLRRRRARFLGAAAASVLGVFGLIAGATGTGWAQGPNPTTPADPNLPTPENGLPYKTPRPVTERANQQSQAPRIHAGTQNRGDYWNSLYMGFLDTNVPWNRDPLKRTFDELNTTARIQTSGWEFPLDINNLQGTAPAAPATLDFDDEPVVADVATFTGSPAGTAGTGGVYAGPPATVWTAQVGTPTAAAPSLNATNDNYYRAAAVGRSSTSVDDIPVATRRPTVFTWLPNVPGAVGQGARYFVRVKLPDLPDTDAGKQAEQRITDARYVVYYNIKTGSQTFDTNVHFVVCQLSQEQAGFRYLVDLNGQPYSFTFASEAHLQANATVPRGRVELDNTTEGDTANHFVIADEIQFVGQADIARATPTVTHRHGGRKMIRNATSPTGGGVPAGFAAGSPVPAPYQQPSGTPTTAAPTVDPRRNLIDTNPLVVGADVAQFNDSYDFINNPRDVDVGSGGAATAGNGDPIYNVPTVLPPPAGDPGNLYQPYEAWNPSTLFQGPSSLIEDDQVADNTALNGFLNRGGSSRFLLRNRRNNVRHTKFRDGSGAVVPYFSHYQVLMPRTEYVLDPTDRLGVRTLEVGAVYAFDGLTGAPIWRFPDRTYLAPNAQTTPGIANPFDIYRDQYNVIVYGAGLRNKTNVKTYNVPGSGTQQRALIPDVPGIGAFDKNLDGRITDDEIYIVGQGGNPSGGIYSSITIAPKIPVQGRVQIPTHAVYSDTYFPTAGGWNPYDLPTNANSSNQAVTPIRGVTDAPIGRYANANGDPVLASVAYVAANNGVLYAIDPYGNNDQTYYASPFKVKQNVTDTDTAGNVGNLAGNDFTSQDVRIGQYHPGTTNVLWSFSSSVPGRLPTQSLEQYNKILKALIPPTGPFGGSSPAIAYGNNEDTVNREDTTITPDLNDARLIVGNENGLVYAMDARAIAGKINGSTTPDKMPFRKGDQPLLTSTLFPNGYAGSLTYYDDLTGTPTGAPGSNDWQITTNNYRTDLRWWFETQGAVVSSPAISEVRHFGPDGNVPQNDPQALGGGGFVAIRPNKGVYVTTTEGRIYCIDWDGPSLKYGGAAPNFEHIITMNWNGQGGDPFDPTPFPVVAPNNGAPTATDTKHLNDNFRFHNGNAATTFARADQTEGTVRPRWTFPNLYRDISGNTPASNNTLQQAADNSRALAGARMAEPSTLGPINGAPSLMDFVWNNPFTKALEIKRYVVLAANDPNGDDPAVSGKLYLLDQQGDRRDFVTNPTAVTQTTTTGTRTVSLSQPLDRYQPGAYTFGNATPAWMFRYEYKRYDAATGRNEDVQKRNKPFYPAAPNGSYGASQSGADVGDPNNAFDRTRVALPTRRSLPTIFAGGVGRLFAVDIDYATGLFQRWRRETDPALPRNRTITPLPRQYTLADIPGGLAEADRLLPANPIFAQVATNTLVGENLADRRILARTVELINTQTVQYIAISGGPMQNRNNLPPIEQTGGQQLKLPTVPGGLDTAAGGTYVGLPSNDAPYTVSSLIGLTQQVQPPFRAPAPPVGGFPPVTVTVYDPTAFPSVDPLDVNAPNPLESAAARLVNQDIDDPLTTSRGAARFQPAATPLLGLENFAYQYPSLFVTTGADDALANDGGIQELSTNIEGVADDITLLTSDNLYTDATTVGWGLEGVDEDFRGDYLGGMSFGPGPGGRGVGVAIVTNAYFASLDPAYRNNVFKPYNVNPSLGDPSGMDGGTPNRGWPVYPPYEPNVDPDAPVATPAPVPPPVGQANPRPRFDARKLWAGNQGNADPDATPATPDGYPYTFADAHTGRTGLPLDLSGLFYDKRYATNKVAIAAPFGTNDPANTVTNDDGMIALPGYSDIGRFLRDNPLVFPGIVPLVSNEAPDPLPDNNNQLDSLSDPTLGTYDPTRIDINPVATNVVWVYTGGTDGTVHAYTPALLGQQNGGNNSGIIGNPGLYPWDFGRPRLELLTETDYNTLLGRAQSGSPPFRTTPDMSLMAQGQRPFYEYGQKIYFSVSDIGYRNPATATAGQVATQENVTIILRDRLKGTIVKRVIVSLARLISTGAVSTYPTDPSYFPGADPDGFTPDAVPLAAAFGTIDIDESAAFTPGAQLELVMESSPAPTGDTRFMINGRQVTLRAQTGGASEAEALENQRRLLTVANPFAVKGFLASTQTVNGLPAIVEPDGQNATKLITRGGVNSIGPFISREETKANYPDLNYRAPDNTLATDPDRQEQEYAEALANGNLITRYSYDPFERLNPNVAIVGTPIRNKRQGDQLDIKPAGSTTATGKDRQFYVPVATSASMIDHGKEGSTTLANNRIGLRVGNRSRLTSLGKVRVEAVGDGLRRTWPGRTPNLDATDADAPTTSTPYFQDPGAPGGANPRYTPISTYGPNAGKYAMRTDGIVNLLPWEQTLSEVTPWKNQTTGTILGAQGGNASLDYPDIIFNRGSSGGAGGTSAVRAIGASGDLVAGAGSLNAIINGPPTGPNATIEDPTLLDPTATATGTALRDSQLGMSISVPLYQPANLVAMHSLTSTYRAASFEEAGGGPLGSNQAAITTTPGPIQLPRANPGDAAPRLLRRTDNGAPSVTPFGYTGRMRVYIDANGNGQWDSGTNGTAEEAYREFEVWFGVPVDLDLKQNESVIDLKSLQHGFGIQDGLLGYDPAAPGNPGLLPPPLVNANVGTGNLNTFSDFFKVFTVQNKGNTNAMNVRASQRVSNFADGSNYVYYGLRSETVDPRFAILAAAADPITPSGRMPQIVTSLDSDFDATLDLQLQTAGSAFNPTPDPGYLVPFVGPDGLNYNRYTAFYQSLGGRHTITKPRVGAPNPSVLSIPDVPAAALPPSLDANGNLLPPPVAEATRIAVAVPLGTPSGTYSSGAGSTPFAIFEDHDTPAVPNEYEPVPVPVGDPAAATGWLRPAGPLYAGQNYVHFKRLGAATTILPATGEGILRPRALISVTGGGTQLEYLPYTDPTMKLIARVTEAGLTGQVGDQALTVGGVGPAIVTGTLPGIDPFPYFDLTGGGIGSGRERVASALTPAAFRSAATGNLFVFASRQNLTAPGAAQAQPGSPYKLYESGLAWNSTQGFWQANNYGTPKDAATVAAAANTASWFTAPVQVQGIGAVNESNVSPFVLYDPLLMSPGDYGVGAVPTLFWLNSVPVAGGQPVTQILRATVDPTTGAVGTATPLIAPASLDTSVRRFGPRAAYVPNGTALVFYYGGTGNSATLSLLYGGLPAGGDGSIAGGAQINRERPLTIPVALSSATEPTAVVRSLPVDATNYPQRYANENAAVNTWVTSNPYVVDLYFSGVSRANRSPDLYMMRYRVRDTGNRATLSPVDLPRVLFEELSASGNEAIYTAKHIGWYRSNLNAALPADPYNNDKRPIIQVFQRGVATATIGPDGWQYDPATQFLFRRGLIGTKETIVYVDTSAGVVRFRGPGAPSPSVPNTVVRATYTPLAYRLTPDPASDSAPFAFADRTPVLSGKPEVDGSGNYVGRPIAGNPGGNTQTFRTNTLETMNREWVFWQKGAQAGRPAAVYYTTRRVGFDLKALGILGADESIQLTLPGDDPRNNQYPKLSATVNGATIPLEIDFAKGRAYTESILEGEIATVTGLKTKSDAGATPTAIDATVRLQLLDEYVNAPSENGTAALTTTAAVAAPVTRAINEGQPYPFLDVYNFFPEGQMPPHSFTRTTGQPSGGADPYGTYNDPQLQWGRVWLFWTSSRGRTGLLRDNAGQTINLSGYDVFWQTLAPQFGTPSVSLFPQP